MINRFIGDWSDLIQVDATKEMSLVDFIKASFGGDRSAAGRYAAQQRWKNQQKKIEKPKDDGTPPVDPRLVDAQKILVSAFNGDAISALRDAGSAGIVGTTGVFIGPTGVANQYPPTDEEKRLADQVEAAGGLISQVIGEELAKLENEMFPKKEELQDKIKVLDKRMNAAFDKKQLYVDAVYEKVGVDRSEIEPLMGEVNPLFEGSELARLNPIDTVGWAIREGQRKIMNDLASGKMTVEQLSNLTDGDLFQLIATNVTNYKPAQRARALAEYGDTTLHSRSDVTGKSSYSREQKNQAYLAVMRQSLEGDFGKTIRAELPKLGDVQKTEQDSKDMTAARAELKKLVITPEQRQSIVKKALSDVGVEFGKAGQVPVAMQGKTERVGGYGKVTFARDADQTPRGRKFQGLIDEAVQLLPGKLWQGSESPFAQVVGTKMATNIELDIKNGRAHAQKLRANLGVAVTTKLKLESVKLNEEPSTSWRSVALHEMGHAAENGNQWLMQMQYAYWERRRAGEPIQKLSKLTGNRGYRATEVAVKDKWGEPYAGKVYNQSRNSSFEIFTMGLEGVFYGSKNLDPDHRAFTLGLLALSTQIKD